jgi:uncharacterized protein involved in exopolysaccharide biosynthesis
MLTVNQAAEDEGRVAPDVQHASLQPLGEHRLFITVFILSALLSALVLTYVYSERYRAETTIFFKSSDVTRIGSHSTMALGSPLPTLPYKVVTQTINGLVDSDQLLRRVVTDLHLDAEEPKDYSGPWYIRYYKELKDWLSDWASDVWKIVRFGRIIKEDPVNKAITDLRKQVKVRNDDSYVYTIQVTGKTPQRAVAIADHLSTALIDLVHRDEARAAQVEIAKLGGLRDGKITEIKEIETRMRDLLAGVQIASIKEEIDKLTALSSQLQENRSNTTADLRQSEAKLAGLTAKLRLPNSPAPLVGGDTGVGRQGAGQPNRIGVDDYAKLTTDRHNAEITTGSLRARLDSIDRSFAALTRRLEVLNQIQAEYDLISAQLGSAKRDYSALTDAYQELVIRTTSAQSELRIQAKAEPPELPVSPIKIYHVAAAGALAALLAIGLAYVLDYFEIHVFLPPAGRNRRRRREAARSPLAELEPEPAAMRLDTD